MPCWVGGETLQRGWQAAVEVCDHGAAGCAGPAGEAESEA